MRMLSDPLIANGDINDWQHRAILLAFLAQEQPKLALKYSRIRKPPLKGTLDIKLQTTILVANGMIPEAFQYQRKKRNTLNADEMLKNFFEKAEAQGKLDSVLQLSLMPVEEKALISFLQSAEKVGSQEILLMYYLQRSRYHEAMKLNEHLNSLPMGQARKEDRMAIMDRYSKANLIPNTLMHRYGPGTSLSDSLKLRNPVIRKPVPMSVEMRSRDFNPVFHASVIQEEMEKRRAETENRAC